jgi:hypothetical protein
LFSSVFTLHWGYDVGGGFDGSEPSETHFFPRLLNVDIVARELVVNQSQREYKKIKISESERRDRKRKNKIYPID